MILPFYFKEDWDYPILAQLVEHLTVDVIIVIKMSLVRFRQVGIGEPTVPL